MMGKLIRRLAACALLAALAPAQAFWVPISNSAIEYQNEITGHYLLLSSTEDMAFVDRGLAGPGWVRTGYYFSNYTFNPNIVDLAPKPVCRFYSAINNSHFFTASAVECEILKQPGTGWDFEKIAFSMEVPGAGGCASGRVPVYRLYNNRHAVHDANHRYTADSAVRAAMQASGWSDEGVAFCASSAGTAPEKSFNLIPQYPNITPLVPTADCEQSVGTCVGLTQLGEMPVVISPWGPPWHTTQNLAYPWSEIMGLTGLEQQDLRTAEPEGSLLVARRSFIQMGPPFGIHIQGSERTGGVYAGMSPMRVLPGVASAAGDERVFPWRAVADRTLVLTAQLAVPRIRRASESAHAYGHPMLQFADQRSGHSFFVTLQAFGTLPAADFVGTDARTGIPIVSTSFRATPAFGKRLAGEFVRCDADYPAACIAARTTFKFALNRADFRSVIERARAVDPALSPNAADYFVGSFRMHNETYLDAELGMALYDMTLEIFAAGAPG